MADDNRPRLGLGRGLAALMGENTIDAPAREGQQAQRRAPIEFLHPNPKNPRRSFDEEQLAELAASIKEKGVVQPILVRNSTKSGQNYEIIAGERRWRAAQLAGLHDVPIVVVEASDREALEIAIVENVQRADLNALEEARAYEQLAADFGYTQADLSRIIGKSRSHIANIIRLLKLPDYARGLLSTGALSAGHGRALLAFPDADSVAKRAVEEGLTVRDLERLAHGAEESHAPELKSLPARDQPKDADTRKLERELSEALGLFVEIKNRGGQGSIVIKYKTLEQLDGVLAKLKS